MKKFKPKVKRVIRRDATVRISTVMKVTGNCSGHWHNQEELISVKITKPTYTTMTAFPANKTGKRKLLKFLKEELYL